MEKYVTRPTDLLRSVTIALLVASGSAAASAQESSLQVRVAVGPMSGPAEDAALAAIYAAVRSTVSLTLRLLGTYRVSDAPEVDVYADQDAALQYLADNRLDNLIFGRALRDDVGAGSTRFWRTAGG
jgi:hypothetical protein